MIVLDGDWFLLKVVHVFLIIIMDVVYISMCVDELLIQDLTFLFLR